MCSLLVITTALACYKRDDLMTYTTALACYKRDDLMT